MTAALTLGARVRYSTHLIRRDSRPGEFNGPDRLWTTEAYPGKENPGGEGIVVGARTLSNGDSDWHGYDDGMTYTPREHFPAYLIAYDLRRKPVFVKPEDVEPIEEVAP